MGEDPAIEAPSRWKWRRAREGGTVSFTRVHSIGRSFCSSERGEIRDQRCPLCNLRTARKIFLVIPEQLRYRDVLGYLYMTVEDASRAMSKEVLDAKEVLAVKVRAA